MVAERATPDAAQIAAVAYQKAIDELDAQRKYIESLRPHLKVAGALAAAFPALSMYVVVGYGSGTLRGALVMVNDLEDMGQMVPLQHWLVQQGYHIKGYHDFAEIRRRTYDYGELQLSAFLKAQHGARCSFVQVGVKEQPVYELRCEDGTAEAS